MSLSLLAFFGFCGFLINIWLYLDDIRNRGGVLDKVISDKKEELDKGMETPKITRQDLNVEQQAMFEGDVEFKPDRENDDEQQPNPNKLSTISGMDKDALKRSMARSFHK